MIEQKCWRRIATLDSSGREVSQEGLPITKTTNKCINANELAGILAQHFGAKRATIDNIYAGGNLIDIGKGRTLDIEFRLQGE